MDKYACLVDCRDVIAGLSMTNIDLLEESRLITIAVVERDCNLPKETLRVWERGYGFPKPLRDGNGERFYPIDQLATLRLLRRLVVAGHRSGQVVGLQDL